MESSTYVSFTDFFSEKIYSLLIHVWKKLHQWAEVTLPQGSFKTNYGECLFGSLTESEMKLSDIMVEAWTNFATYGNPGSPNNTRIGASLLPNWPTWSDDQPYFLRFGLSKTELTTLDAEYTKTYSTKPFSSRDLFPNFEISNYAEEPIIINIP